MWTLVNDSGGWIHPLHLHQEEHRIQSRNGVAAKTDDISKEDVVALGPGEEVLIFRRFRTFTGPYVAHCHNLAHEDHAMMFGWEIV
jgi:FtsP/CotA-like multicopper oxidase with cupredoxin domain